MSRKKYYHKSRKKYSHKLINLIFILILSLYLLMLLVVPSKIAFSDSATVFIKSNVNYILLILGIIFLIINTNIYLSFLKRKIYKISNVRGKQLSVQKKHPRKMAKDLIAFLIIYFFVSNLIIFYSSFNVIFSRYALTKNGVECYNFLGQRVERFDLESFNRFEIGTQYSSSRTGSSVNFYIKTDGPITISFNKIHDKKQALELMAKLKESYNTKVDKNDIRLFQRKSGYTSWSIEERKLFSEIFDL